MILQTQVSQSISPVLPCERKYRMNVWQLCYVLYGTFMEQLCILKAIVQW